MTSTPRAVLVHRRTDYEELLAAHGTRGQAEFFLRTRDQRIGPVLDRHRRIGESLARVSAQVPSTWRRAKVERAELAGFVFEPGDVVIVAGPDGLVANAGRYLDGQPVLGVNPDPHSIGGVLVTLAVADVADRLREVARGTAAVLERTMVQATLDDGQQLVALNEIFAGHRSHQSARYRLLVADRAEEQSSSGVLVGTGTGATGWLASLDHDRGGPVRLPGPGDPELAWYVREAWPSATTGTRLTAGSLATGEEIRLVARTDLVCFADGMEIDALTVGHGRELTLRVARRRLRTVT